MTTLVDRRVRDDMIEVYKIVTVEEKVQVKDFFYFIKSTYDLRGQSYKLDTKRSHLEVGLNFFFTVIRPWN